MDRQEAREHVELLDRILQSGDQRLHVGAELYVVWGASSALLEVLFQLALDGRIASSWVLAGVGALVASLIFSIVRSIAYRRDAERMTFMQREYLNVLWLSFALAGAASYGAGGIFHGWAQAAVWNLAGTFVLFFIGLHNNRGALVGGIIMLVSIVAANYLPAVTGYVLAAGMIAGYAGFGVSALLARM